MSDTPVTDARSANLPDLPSGWQVTTRTATHVACYSSDTGRAVAIFPTGSGNSGGRGWSALGLSGYGPDCPRLARRAAFEDAAAAAVEEMAAVNQGNPTTAEDVAEQDREETVAAGKQPAGAVDEDQDERGGVKEADQATLSVWGSSSE
ncbi:hypothetical protein [Halobacterium rubrum]|uniref:hypothetical protein n=1 Tax=Halobacterium TaxID=2239 RepID=UPI001F40BD90|nr:MULTISPECIES: hypothetical protein [Halobacterium]MDH5021742.1 hypothetical protein [Halobacterium rubrum]